MSSRESRMDANIARMHTESFKLDLHSDLVRYIISINYPHQFEDFFIEKYSLSFEINSY